MDGFEDMNEDDTIFHITFRFFCIEWLFKRSDVAECA